MADVTTKVKAASTDAYGTVKDPVSKAYVDEAVAQGGYVLPAATASALGGVKVGSGLSVTDDGTLSADKTPEEAYYTFDVNPDMETFKLRNGNGTVSNAAELYSDYAAGKQLTLKYGVAAYSISADKVSDTEIWVSAYFPTSQNLAGSSDVDRHATLDCLVIQNSGGGVTNDTEWLGSYQSIPSATLYASSTVALSSSGSLYIPDGGITSAKLADGAVTAGKIADGAITADKLASGAAPDVYVMHVAWDGTNDPTITETAANVSAAITAGKTIIAQVTYSNETWSCIMHGAASYMSGTARKGCTADNNIDGEAVDFEFAISGTSFAFKSCTHHNALQIDGSTITKTNDVLSAVGGGSGASRKILGYGQSGGTKTCGPWVVGIPDNALTNLWKIDVEWTDDWIQIHSISTMNTNIAVPNQVTINRNDGANFYLQGKYVTRPETVYATPTVIVTDGSNLATTTQTGSATEITVAFPSAFSEATLIVALNLFCTTQTPSAL